MSESKVPNPYASGKHTQSIAAQTQGKKFKVVNAPPEPHKIWGDNLTWNEAHKLKEKTAASRKSKNVVILGMEDAIPGAEPPTHSAVGRPLGAVVPPRPADPELAAAYDAGIAAASGAAAAAQARADALAKQKELEQVPPLAEGEGIDGEFDDGEISDILASEGQMPTEADIEAAADVPPAS